jgi:N-acetylgalactosamine-6-sulfatase
MELDQSTYVAMLEDLDAEVGRILSCLDQKGIRDQTLVVFASDNGGFEGAAQMGTLRGAKGTTLEGGIRVPLIARWPGRIPRGTVSDQVCVTFDLTRSFLELARADVTDSRLEGYDIIGHVIRGNADFARTLFWRGKRGERVWSAVRDGDLKLVEKREQAEQARWLYDLAVDAGETNDLKQDRARDATRLQSRLRSWEEDVSPKRW